MKGSSRAACPSACILHARHRVPPHPPLPHAHPGVHAAHRARGRAAGQGKTVPCSMHGPCVSLQLQCYEEATGEYVSLAEALHRTKRHSRLKYQTIDVAMPDRFSARRHAGRDPAGHVRRARSGAHVFAPADVDRAKLSATTPCSGSNGLRRRRRRRSRKRASTCSRPKTRRLKKGCRPDDVNARP